jgi:hypothetical protein
MKNPSQILSTLLLLFLWNHNLTSASSIIDTCLSQGFDPANLSCETCVLLQSTDYHLTCLECCQSYKTLDSKTSRYAAAILVHVVGQSEEIDKFVQDELPQIQSTKLGITVETSNDSGFGFFGMRPSMLYFFKNKFSGKSARDYAELSQEQIVLYGWSKDDLKDMIQTLLPDKKK